jgi:glycosyltransferase involved in cell wall biosynthesis
MKILLVSNLFPPYWLGGYELMAGWVAEGLRARGHSVEVLTGRGPALAEKEGIRPELDLDLPGVCEAHRGEGITFPRGWAEDWQQHVFNRRNRDACEAAIEQGRPDLVSFWNPAFITFAPLLAAKRARVPAVVHLSDVAANPFRNPHPPAFSWGRRGLARLAVDRTLRRADARAFVVPSTFLGAKLVAEEGLPARRMVVLHWPAPPEFLAAAPPVRSMARASRLLFVGSLAAEKGAPVLLEAFRRAHAEEPELTLTLVGEAGKGSVERLRAMAEGLPVSFRGRLERPEVMAVYADHDILAFPSVWNEPFAIVPLEAMALETAVIASSAGGTPEAIQHEKTGLLVPPGDASRLAEGILRLARDPALTRALGHAGAERVRQAHSFAGYVDRLVDVYEQARTSRRGNA